MQSPVLVLVSLACKTEEDNVSSSAYFRTQQVPRYHRAALDDPQQGSVRE